MKKQCENFIEACEEGDTVTIKEIVGKMLEIGKDQLLILMQYQNHPEWPGKTALDVAFEKHASNMAIAERSMNMTTQIAKYDDIIVQILQHICENEDFELLCMALPYLGTARDKAGLENIVKFEQDQHTQNLTNYRRYTALSVACHCGNSDIVDVICQALQSIDPKLFREELMHVGLDGMAPLHLAATCGDKGMTKNLINQLRECTDRAGCREVVFLEDREGWTALHHAWARNTEPAIARTFLRCLDVELTAELR